MEGFLSRSVDIDFARTMYSLDSTLVDIPLQRKEEAVQGRAPSSRDIVVIIIRHVHFVALRFLLPPRDETPRNQL